MEEKAILFNGGQDRDIEPLEGANPFLARLLGAAPSRPAVPYLRVVQTTEGRPDVGVFIGSEQVGHLQTADEELLATVKACELNGAVARARGNLVASSEHPGQVDVRINLADSEYLLCDPEPESPEQPDAALLPAERDLADAGSAAPEIFAALESASAPALAAGLPEDYPDWPPPKLKTRSFFEPLTPAEGSALDEPLQSDELEPQDEPAPSGLSPQALLSARGTWLGEAATQPQASQTGWLGSATRQSQAPSLGTVAMTPLGGTAAGPGGSTSKGEAAASETGSWQDMAEQAGGAPRDPDEEIIAAWTSSPSAARPTPAVTPVKQSRAPSNTRTWILSALATVVLIAAAFLVWKLVFAPKTYTDDQYGYSFTYPGRWKVIDDGSVFGGPLSVADSAQAPSMAMAGHGMDWSQPNEAAVVGVARAQLTVNLDSPTLTSLVTESVAQMQAQDASVQVLAPVTPATLSGLGGCEMTLSFTTTDGHSLTATYYYLLDQGCIYFVMAGSTNGLWSDSQKTFSAFFRSFKPGGATKS